METPQHLLEAGETLEWHGRPVDVVCGELGQDVHYLITDRRVLIAVGDDVESFAPAALGKLALLPADDGTADVVWDVRRGYRQPERPPGLALRLRRVRSEDRIGFVGVSDGQELLQRLQRWLGERYDELAAVAAEGDWTIFRDPDTGFAIELPEAWSTRVGVLKERRFLGLRIQRPPQWLSAPDRGWNTLETTSPQAATSLVVLINPLEIPNSLDNVLNSRLVSLLGIRYSARNPDLRVGALRGFSVMQDLEGAGGGQVQLGPVSVSTSGLPYRLIQRQIWLRGDGGSVHLLSVTPADGTRLQQVIDRIVASVRFDS